MVNSKIAFTFIFCIVCFTGQSQVRPIFFGGVDYFRDKGFVENSYVNFNVGSQIFRWKFIAPEVGYEYHFGIVRDNNELHPQEPNARAPSKLRTRFSSQTFFVAPKIIIGNKEAAFVFIPQYNSGKIKGRGDLLLDTGRDYYLAEQQHIKNSISFWSFASGVEGQFFDSEILNFSLLLKYSFINSEDVLNQINLENTRLKSSGGSAEGIGFSFRVYADLLQLFKRK